MKTNLKRILCGILSTAVLASSSAVFAADKMELEWYGDYSDNSDPKLVVTFASPANYIQNVTTVIYPQSITNPSLNDYLRMSEITVKGSTETTVTFDIENEFSAEDGAYTLSVVGSGYITEGNSAKTTVYVLPPSKISGLLADINGASGSDLGTKLSKVANALQLDNVTDSQRTAAMDKIKADDFNGNYANLNDVRKAWEISDLTVYINSSSRTVSGLKEKIEKHADAVGIDTDDEDFKKYFYNSDKMCTLLIANTDEYNGNAGIRSCKDLKDAIGETLGILALNDSTTDNILEIFTKYKSYFDIPSETMAIYDKMSNTNKNKVLGKLYNKNLTKPSVVVTNFKDGVALVNSGSGNDVTPTPTPTSKPSSGNSSPGGSSYVPAPSTPSQTGTFSDLTSSHWAYSYVNRLTSKSVINGYDDGTFRPSNNVTREEFVKMIIGATGMLSSSAECEFTDVAKDAWYYEYIASAYEKDVVSGSDDDRFGVGENITRQDVAVIAARILKRFNAASAEVSQTTLTDLDTASDYAKESIELLNAMGILNGFDDGSFMPHNALTRAEAAAIICRLTDAL